MKMDVIRILRNRKGEWDAYEEDERGAEIRRVGICTTGEINGIIRYIGIPTGCKTNAIYEALEDDGVIIIYVNVDGSHAHLITKNSERELW